MKSDIRISYHGESYVELPAPISVKTESGPRKWIGGAFNRQKRTAKGGINGIKSTTVQPFNINGNILVTNSGIWNYVQKQSNGPESSEEGDELVYGHAFLQKVPMLDISNSGKEQKLSNDKLEDDNNKEKCQFLHKDNAMQDVLQAKIFRLHFDMEEKTSKTHAKPVDEESASFSTSKTPSLFKDNDDSSDPEFDSIFNDVTYQSSSSSNSSSTSSLQKIKKRAKGSNFGRKSGDSMIPRQKHQIDTIQNKHQGLLVTCTNETVAARTVQLLDNDNKEEGGSIVTAIGQPIVVAEELGEITAINLSCNGQWLALALSCFQIWIIQLSWKSVKQTKSGVFENDVPKIISSVRHHATLEGHRARIHGLHFLKGSSSILLSVSNDRTFKIWSIELLECLFESPQLGQFSLTCSAILESGNSSTDRCGSRNNKSGKNKSSLILALGNCDGKVIFYDIDSEYEGRKIGECHLDASILIRLSEENIASSCRGENGNWSREMEMRSNGDNPTGLFRNGKKFVDTEGNVSEDFDTGAVIVRSSSKQNRASPATNDSNFYHNINVPKDGETNIEAGCEILSLRFLHGFGESDSKSKGGIASTVSSILDSIPMLVVGTNIGITLVNVRTREVITALSFNHIFQQPKSNRSSFMRLHGPQRGSDDKNDGIFGSMISQLIFGSYEETSNDCSRKVQSNRKCNVHNLMIMGQRTSDAKTFALNIEIQRKSEFSSKMSSCNTIRSSNRESSAKLSFSVVAQAPAKRGSLFENMQRKYENMSIGDSNLTKNPTSILHGKRKGNNGRKMKQSTSVPNLDKNDVKNDDYNRSEVPKLVENYDRSLKNRKSSDPKSNNNINNLIRKTKSSGYGKIYEKIKMFEPNINSPGKRRSSSTSQTRKRNSIRENHYYNPLHGHKPSLHRNSQPEVENSIHIGNESNDEGFISPSTSMTLLQDSVITNTLDDQPNNITENSNTLPRARWNNNRKSRLPQSRQGTIIIEEPISKAPSKQLTSYQLCQTDGVRTRLNFSTKGGSLAAFGIHNSVQILQGNDYNLNSKGWNLENSIPTATKASALGPATSQLMSHIGPVNWADFSHNYPEYVVTSSDDKTVKLWDWRTRTVKLNVDLRKQGRGIGLGKGAIFGSGNVYGGGIQVKKKKKNLETAIPFPDCVNKAQFYYLDQFLLSASANKLYVHQIGGLDSPSSTNGSTDNTNNSQQKSPDDFWFKLAKTFPLPGCKQITTFTAANQFYSYIVLSACSDKTLRLIDLNSQRVTSQISDCHTRPVHKIIQAQYHCGPPIVADGTWKSQNGDDPDNAEFPDPQISDSSVTAANSLYNIFLTGALGDGVKLWDMRTFASGGGSAVQRFDWPGSRGGRFQPGFDLSPCLKYVAVGAEDGHVYIFDTRRFAGAHVGKIPAVPEDSMSMAKSPITDVAFRPKARSSMKLQLIAASLDGYLFEFGE